MERHAQVENGRIIIGEQSYSRVITEHCEMQLDNTQRMLADFVKTGGKIITAEELEPVNIIDNERITYTKRGFDGFNIHYFVNTSDKYEKSGLNISGKIVDIYTGELNEFDGSHEFEPWGSLMLVEDGSKNAEKSVAESSYIRPYGKFRIAVPVENTLLLDRCDYYFDGELQEKNGYVLNICERANALEKAVKLHQDYHVEMRYVPSELFLVCETPEIFDIKVNGKPINKTVCGSFADKSFKKLDISGYVHRGENIISFDCNFVQSEEFYENRRKSFIFESEKNKLVYDMEIEAVYLVGDFTVQTDGEWTALDKKAVRYSGGFVIDKPKEYITIKNIEQQGYPFFCGNMTIEGEIDITGENPVLEIDKKGINAVRVEINGKKRLMLTSDRISLNEFGVRGKTKIRFTIINNLRNLLGPHHLKEGESYAVGPFSFFKEQCLWCDNPEEQWDNNYCFVETGI